MPSDGAVGVGTSLIEASGKLALLDRLIARLRAEGSRILLFSQYTITLDVLSEYCSWRFGAEGRGYMRLDGNTNRIKREMDVRSPLPTAAPAGTQ